MAVLSNRHKYERGRASGPSRLINLNVQLFTLRADQTRYPIIIGNPASYANLYKDLMSEYTSTIKSVINDGTASGSVNQTQIILAEKSNLGALLMNNIWFAQYFNYEQLQQLLNGQHLLVEQVNIQIIRIKSITRDGAIIADHGRPGFFPDSIGVFDSEVNKFDVNRISINSFINPNYGMPRNNAQVKTNPWLVEAPVDVVIGPNSALVIDWVDKQTGIYAMKIGLSVKQFAV